MELRTISRTVVLVTCFVGTSALAQLRPSIPASNTDQVVDAHDLGADRVIDVGVAIGPDGACCVYGQCVPNVTEGDCLGMCGTYQGDGSSCIELCCAYTIDFESIPIQQMLLGCDDAIVNGMPLDGMLLTPFLGLVSDAEGDGYHNGTAAFDSTPGVNQDDEDLQQDQGNVLILQQKHFAQTDWDGNFIRPNDAAQGGEFAFIAIGLPPTGEGADGPFGPGIRPLSMDLLDICVSDGDGALVSLLSFDLDEPGAEPSGILGERTYHIPAGWTSSGDGGVRTLDLTTLNDQPGAGATVATAEEVGDFDPDRVIFIFVILDGSGAVDNLEYCVPYTNDKCEEEK